MVLYHCGCSALTVSIAVCGYSVHVSFLLRAAVWLQAKVRERGLSCGLD